jgi:phytanoyl-CoA hydroxylase
MDPSLLLTPDQTEKQFYDSNGFMVYPGFVTKEKIKQMNDVIDQLSGTLQISDEVFDESGTGKIKQIQYLEKYDQVFKDLIEELRPVAERLIGETDLKVLNMQLFEKHPKISKPTRAHQDNAYFKMTPTSPLTIWIALDDIDEENGCVYYAKLTHLTPTRKHQRYHPHTTFRVRSGVPGLSLCLHEHPDETDVPVIVKSGDLLIHNCNLVHRAGMNNSEDRRRRAIGLVFIPNSCTVDPRLNQYHKDRLKEDIELQKYKNQISQRI